MFLEKIKQGAASAWQAVSGLFRRNSAHKKNERDGELFIERKNARPFLLAVLFSTMKVMLVVGILVGAMGLGLAMGVARAYIETASEIEVTQLTKSDRTSYLYDKNGGLITSFASMEYRDWASIDEIPDMLKNAIIAIEDVRFYKHDGVDYKRIFSAVVNTLRNKDTHGGSTITQQLIKNKILTNEQSYKRKIKEAYLALELDGNILSKDEILEAYLNDQYLGESYYGVKTAAMAYLGKNLSELTIRECAMLAGMFQRPSYTNPRANTYERFDSDGTNKMERTDERTDLVIKSMYSAGFITKAQRDAALSDTVTILEKSPIKQKDDMQYFVDYAIRDIITHLLKQRGLLDISANRTLLERELATGGYSIYLTVDTDIQHTVQDTIAGWDKYPELKVPSQSVKESFASNGTVIREEQPQAAAAIIDYKTGELRAIIGGRTAPVVKKQYNRAYRSRTPVGSSIKPIAVYGPALDLGLSPASVIMNFPVPIEGWGSEEGFPAIGSKEYIGPVTVRRGIVSSLNVVAARTLYEHVGLQASTQYLVNLGIDPSGINSNGSGLALGTSGITPIEMAAAFGAIANEGKYITPVTFTRVVDANGKVVLNADDVRESRQVFKKTTAYLLMDMLTDAVNRGTGTPAKIKGMTVAGKTGTNGDYSSVYFAGMTPYYAASLWVGHDDFNVKLRKGSTGGSYAAPLWQAFMEKIHQGLANKPIIDESPAELGLAKYTVCSISGKLATEACMEDHEHPPVTEWFDKLSAPTETCDMHILLATCAQSGMQASSFCPQVVGKLMLLVSSASPYAQIEPEMLKAYLPNVIYTDIPLSEYGVLGYEPSAICTMHGGGYIDPVQPTLETVKAAARALLKEVGDYLAVVQNLPDTDRATLLNGRESLETVLGLTNPSSIQQYYDYLHYNYTVISSAYPRPVMVP